MSPNTPMNDDQTPNQMTENHISEAFRDLSRRAGTVPVDAGPHLQANGGRRSRNPFGNAGPENRLIPALVFTAVVAIAGFGAWQLLPGDDSDRANVATDGELDDGAIDGTEDGNGDPIATDDGTSDGTDTTTGDENPDSPPPPGEAGARYRVDTTKVAADTSDPFLNVRRGPGAGSELLAKLPPTYRGIVLTGETTTTDDGATWFAVQLTDPVQVNLGEPLHGGLPVGWVNAAFLVPLDRPASPSEPTRSRPAPSCPRRAAHSAASPPPVTSTPWRADSWATTACGWWSPSVPAPRRSCGRTSRPEPGRPRRSPTRS